MPRRISKIPSKAKIEPLTKRYSEGFQPVQFGKNPPIPVKSKPSSGPSAVKAAAQKTPPPSQQGTANKEENPTTVAAKEAKPKKPEAPPEPTHPYSALISVLKALWMDRNLHSDLCPDTDIFRLYMQNSLSRINTACARLDHVKQDKEKEKQWVEEMFRPILNGIGVFYSQIARKAYHDDRSAEALKKDIEARLYGSIDLAVRDYKWFRLQKVKPYKDKYNHFLPKQTLVGTVPVPGKLVDVILEIQSVGLMSLNNLAIIDEAQVIIGVPQ